MNQELKTALFAAESVAHLHGFEREILPLADYARGQAARIVELVTALADCAESLSRLPDVDGAFRATCYQQAAKTLANTIAP